MVNYLVCSVKYLLDHLLYSEDYLIQAKQSD